MKMTFSRTARESGCECRVGMGVDQRPSHQNRHGRVGLYTTAVTFHQFYMWVRERLPFRDDQPCNLTKSEISSRTSSWKNASKCSLPDGTEFSREIEEFFEQVAGKQEEALGEN